MLTKPDLKDETIIKCLWDEYGLSVNKISFLPLGADLNTAVYQIVTTDETAFFLKLRSGEFNEATVAIPKYLSDLGIKQVIPSLLTRSGQLWTDLAPFKTILYPYIEGHNAIEQSLSTQQWIEFGTALKKIHTADIPLEITTSIQQENFSSRWRNTVKTFLEQNENEDFDEPVAKAMAAFLKCKGIEILDLVKRAEQLVQILQLQSLEYTLCHADIHGWNLLVAKDGALFIVDWDTLILAPKERDLMFIGAGLGDSGRSPQEEEILFYQGYGQTNVNQVAIAYYRYERIIEDIAVYCEQIICSNEGEEDRKQSLVYLKSNFLPNNTIERAYQADKTVRL